MRKTLRKVIEETWVEGDFITPYDLSLIHI